MPDTLTLDDAKLRILELEAERAALIAKFANPAALVPLAKQFGLQFKIESGVPFVRTGDAGTWQKLTDAVNADPLKPFAPALIGSASATDKGSSSGASGDLVGDFLKRNSARANVNNPLRSSSWKEGEFK